MSPRKDAKQTKMPKKNDPITENPAKLCKTTEVMTVLTVPPANPSHDLLGLRMGRIFLLPTA